MVGLGLSIFMSILIVQWSRVEATGKAREEREENKHAGQHGQRKQDEDVAPHNQGEDATRKVEWGCSRGGKGCTKKENVYRKI